VFSLYPILEILRAGEFLFQQDLSKIGAVPARVARDNDIRVLALRIGREEIGLPGVAGSPLLAEHVPIDKEDPRLELFQLGLTLDVDRLSDSRSRAMELEMLLCSTWQKGHLAMH